jgi:hypothetical protein
VTPAITSLPRLSAGPLRLLAWRAASNDGTDRAVEITRAARIAALYDEIVIIAEVAADPAVTCVGAQTRS